MAVIGGEVLFRYRQICIQLQFCLCLYYLVIIFFVSHVLLVFRDKNRESLGGKGIPGHSRLRGIAAIVHEVDIDPQIGLGVLSITSRALYAPYPDGKRRLLGTSGFLNEYEGSFCTLMQSYKNVKNFFQKVLTMLLKSDIIIIHYRRDSC